MYFSCCSAIFLLFTGLDTGYWFLLQGIKKYVEKHIGILRYFSLVSSRYYQVSSNFLWVSLLATKNRGGYCKIFSSFIFLSTLQNQ